MKKHHVIAKAALATGVILATGYAFAALAQSAAPPLPTADDFKTTIDAGQKAIEDTKTAVASWQHFALAASAIWNGIYFLIVQGSAWSRTIRDAPGAKLIAGNYGKAENKA